MHAVGHAVVIVRQIGTGQIVYTSVGAPPIHTYKYLFHAHHGMGALDPTRTPKVYRHTTLWECW